MLYANPLMNIIDLELGLDGPWVFSNTLEVNMMALQRGQFCEKRVLPTEICSPRLDSKESLGSRACITPCLWKIAND